MGPIPVRASRLTNAFPARHAQLSNSGFTAPASGIVASLVAGHGLRQEVAAIGDRSVPSPAVIAVNQFLAGHR